MDETERKIDIDLINRDPQGINHYARADVTWVLAEPSGTHSENFAWECSSKCYSCTRTNFYKCWTFCCGFLCSFLWGCFYACLSFCIIWCATPTLRLIQITTHPFKKICTIWMAALCGPLREAQGLYYGRINVTYSQDAPPKRLTDQYYVNI